MSPAQRRNLFIILILGALSTISPFAIDMYLPAFGQIAADMNTVPSTVALSLSSYFIGLAAGQLAYGPLLDRYGRKRPLYAGLTLFVFASIGCMTSHTVESLIIWRFFQALGGCVAQVAATAMVHDFFPVKESAKIFSLLILILGVSPLLAPTVGGFVTTSLGWHWVFILLAGIVLVIMGIVHMFLPEGHQPDTTISLKPRPIVHSFLLILKEPQFYTHALAGALSFAGLFAYVAGSPIIFMNIFSVSPQMYGGIFAMLSVGFIGGSQLNIWLTRKFGSARIFLVALICQTVIGGIFMIGAYNGWYGLYATLACLFMFLPCIGIGYPNAAALALAPFSKNAGSASALLGFIQIGMGAVASCGVGMFHAPTLFTIVLLMCGWAGLALLALLVARRNIDPRHAVEVEAAAAPVMH
ncbi:MAG: multidrug effflux MFS transporter [Micavibrio sp.]|nr:multidrug effflux MFS transporter [Micavibrio sp.]